MKLLLIGNARADRYAQQHQLIRPTIVRNPDDTLSLYPHPHDTLIYFGDEDAFTVDALWSRGFTLFKNVLPPSSPPPPQQSLNL